MRILLIVLAVAERIRFERADASGYWQIWELSIYRQDDEPVEFTIVDGTPALNGSKLDYVKDDNPVTRYIAWCDEACFLEIEVPGAVSTLSFLWKQDAAHLRAITSTVIPLAERSISDPGKSEIRWTHPGITRVACPSVDGVSPDGLRCSSSTECEIDVPCEGDRVGNPLRCLNGVWSSDVAAFADSSSQCVNPNTRWRVSAERAVRFHEVSFRTHRCLEAISATPGRDGVAFGRGKLRDARKAFDGDSETYFIAPDANPRIEFRFRESMDESSEIQCAVVETGPYKGVLTLEKLVKDGWQPVFRSMASPEYRTKRTLSAIESAPRLALPVNDTVVICNKT